MNDAQLEFNRDMAGCFRKGSQTYEYSEFNRWLGLFREGTTFLAWKTIFKDELSPNLIICRASWVLFLPMCLEGWRFHFEATRIPLSYANNFDCSFTLKVSGSTSGKLLTEHSSYCKGSTMPHKYLLSKLFQAGALPESVLEDSETWKSFPLAWMVYLHPVLGIL